MIKQRMSYPQFGVNFNLVERAGSEPCWVQTTKALFLKIAELSYFQTVEVHFHLVIEDI